MYVGYWGRSQPLGFIARFLLNVAALWVAGLILPGMHLEGAGALFFSGLILAVVNTFIRPVVLFLACPLTILTLGLFVLVVNALMLLLTAWLARQLDMNFEFDSFGWAILAALIVAAVTLVLERVLASALRR